MTIHHKLIATSIVAAFAASPALAQEAKPDTWTDKESTKTREEVRAKAVDALEAGKVGHGEVSRPRVGANFESTKTADQVRAEGEAAARLDLIGRGERAAPSPTPEEARKVRQAGLEAKKDAPKDAR